MRVCPTPARHVAGPTLCVSGLCHRLPRAGLGATQTTTDPVRDRRVKFPYPHSLGTHHTGGGGGGLSVMQEAHGPCQVGPLPIGSMNLGDVLGRTRSQGEQYRVSRPQRTRDPTPHPRLGLYIVIMGDNVQREEVRPYPPPPLR